MKMTRINTIGELLEQLRKQGCINSFDAPLVADAIELLHSDGKIHSAGAFTSQWGDAIDSLWIVPIGGSREIIKELKRYSPDVCRTQRLNGRAAKEAGSSTSIIAWWD